MVIDLYLFGEDKPCRSLGISFARHSLSFFDARFSRQSFQINLEMNGHDYHQSTFDHVRNASKTFTLKGISYTLTL